ncbi:sodium/glutamate symporter [Parabacteroides sp. APC149_11_2_Y6]
MIDIQHFTPWTLFTDIGFISILLLIGKVIRVYVKLVQKLFIPPSLLAGLLGLTFGPNGLGWIPFSDNIGTYAAVLIALVFGSLPLSSPKMSMKLISGRVGPMWAYAQVGMLMQWGLAGLFGLFVIKQIWPDLNDAFGIMLSTGFYGGHGTAAAIGAAFDGLGWEDAFSLAMTTATVGIICAIIGGLIMIKWAARHKQTSFISDFDDLPDELRSGLLPENKRESIGTATTSSISIDSLTFHSALVFVIALLGYAASQWVKIHYPMLELPVFSCAFVIGLLLKQVFDLTRVSTYICPVTTQRLSSSFTDLLVAFGVASIKLGIVVKYAVPLIVLIVGGVIIVWGITFYLGRRLAKTYWFERTIFAWGWWTGTMAMGIALLRIVDPKLASKAMDDYALAYLPIAPVEILLITFVPILFVNGFGVWLSLACVGISLLILLFARKMGWWNKKAVASK